VIKRIQPENAKNHQPREQTTSSTDAEIDEQRPRKVNGSDCEDGSRCIGRGEQAGGVLRIHFGQVEKEALEDDEDTHGIHRDANHRNDPVNFGLGRPSEDEDADRWEEAADHGWEEDLFGVGTFAGEGSRELLCSC
jgi:hypothetical protein